MPLAVAATLLPLMTMGASAPAEGYAFPIDIQSQTLGPALRELARETGIELLFDEELVRGLRSPRLRQRLSIDQALRLLLAGTGLTARRSATGTWLIERRAATATTTVADTPQPEILIVGRRTQNADIRRRENDIQPYRVTTGREIIDAHRDDLDQYFRSRVTANTIALPPSLQNNGQTNSQIDLRGLGTGGTLILVDGRRMPDVTLAPTLANDTDLSTFGFGQPDINAIPLNAIDRVETLTGTAGGIYGFGALGGVVNIVLKRDYRGVDLHATTGISARGDARRLRLEGRLGFTPDGGRTDVMVNVSRSWSQPLYQEQRGYTARGRLLNFHNAPDQILHAVRLGLYGSNAVAAVDLFGDPLVFKPEYGGASLGSDVSYLPSGFAGTPSDLVATLTRNAGKVSPVPTDLELASELGSNPTTTSVIFSVRHEFSDKVEAYVDGLILRNHGKSLYRTRLPPASELLYPDSPDNPFENFVEATFPVSPVTSTTRARADFDSERLTAGAIVTLPFDWKATAEATFGRARYSYDLTDIYYGRLGFEDPGEGPPIVPFGNWDTLQRAAASYALNARDYGSSYNRYREQSLRLAGPTFRTAAGPATLTLLAERREEKVPPFIQVHYDEIGGPETIFSPTSGRSSKTGSLYGELRAPLFGNAAPFPLLRQFELQFAVRYDHLDTYFSRDPNPDQFSGPGAADRLHRAFSGTTFTAGAKAVPLPWLMLRGSYATGRQAPPLTAMIEYEGPGYYLSDPKRDGEVNEDYIHKYNGSTDLKTVRATTVSLGVVLNPLGDKGPRFSLDYSLVRRTRDAYYVIDDFILAHEEAWPDRVTRAPLTDADRALGYTGGKILVVDARALSAGGLLVETLDGKLDWAVPFLAGTLRVSGSATVQLRNELLAPFTPRIDQIDFLLSPLRWRANGGAEWTIGATSVGATLQFFGRYRNSRARYQSVSDTNNALQGDGGWVHSQLYLDLSASRRFRLGPGGREFTLDFGIVNVFDRLAPYEGDITLQGPQYSRYGDPRGRRFELSLGASF